MKKSIVIFIFAIGFLILSSFTLTREGFDMMIDVDSFREEGSYEHLNEEGQTQYCATNLTFDKCQHKLSGSIKNIDDSTNNCEQLFENCDSTLEKLNTRLIRSNKFQVVYIVLTDTSEESGRESKILNALMNVQKNIINKTRVQHNEKFPNGILFGITDEFWKLDKKGLHKKKWTSSEYDPVDKQYSMTDDYTTDVFMKSTDSKQSLNWVHLILTVYLNQSDENVFKNRNMKFMYFIEDGKGGYCFSATVSKSNSQSLILLNGKTTGRIDELGEEMSCEAQTGKFNGLHMYDLEQDDVLTFRLTHEMLHNLGIGHLDNNDDNTDESNALYSQTSGNGVPDFDEVNISDEVINSLATDKSLERHFLVLEKPLSNDTPIIGNFSYNDLKIKIEDVLLTYSLHT